MNRIEMLDLLKDILDRIKSSEYNLDSGDTHVSINLHWLPDAIDQLIKIEEAKHD